ncbi:BlaI/MecI/CopY family transcriptional regulator [Streptomyces sp. NPDC001652]|uniref:BlaI/MecI/CopY family transcriptional regulator n=1 Tax=Streptomyces sp. NPDC001652 TaxID=3154393 RepID=UPI00332E07DE
MSENTSTSTELTSQYTAQVTTDLERNLKEQERIHQEIAALQQQLATLQHDHSVLVNMHQALGLTVPTTESAPTTEPESTTESITEADTSAAPAPAKKAGTRRSRQPKKGTAPKAPKAPKTPKAPTSSASKSEAKSAEPTLVSLIRDHLAAQSEPRSTAEIAATMGQTHPERGIKATVVRTTLEGLVAKGLVQRVKQGSSVYYTASDAAQPAEEQASTDAQTDTAT